jgi:hypothetical protein
MAYKFNPFTGNLDDVGAGAAAFEVLGTVATVGDLPGGATQGDVYLVEADANFYVWDGSAWSSLGTLAGPQGPTGATGAVGPAGADGADGVGVDAGGTTGQVLAKASNTDYDTEWVDQTGGGGTPGGSDTQVQFNDGGAFGGDSGLTYDDTAGALTVGGKTATTDSPVLNLSQTWNNAATTFTGLKLNVTDTASAAGSNLLDLQVGGTSLFKVNNNGSINIYTVGTNTPTGFGIGSVASSLLATYFANRWNAAIGSDRLVLESTSWLGFSSLPGTNSNFPAGGNVDTRLYRDSAGTLAQRNGTNAQTFRLYNTYTDASNYERTSITRDSSGLVIDAQKGGTGVDPTNLLDVQVGGVSAVQVRDNEIKYSGSRVALYTGTGGGGSVDISGVGSLDTVPLRVEYNLITIANRAKVGFTTGTNINTGVDVALSRDSAGVVKITDGSTGTGYLKLIPTTVGALTAAATVGAGTKAFVTDSTSTLSSHHGQAVVGGGSNFVPVFSDGTNWIVG